jgi:hypothetical protein
MVEHLHYLYFREDGGRARTKEKIKRVKQYPRVLR